MDKERTSSPPSKNSSKELLRVTGDGSSKAVIQSLFRPTPRKAGDRPHTFKTRSLDAVCRWRATPSSSSSPRGGGPARARSSQERRGSRSKSSSPRLTVAGLPRHIY
ncbi:hypothetical protein C7M84_000740 [Penaeus vannamei]|uniref:Uncharacterized protein n=1 Tax=Penaeus vannamei TaxID=6689 RepID=A0A3R7PXV4_PENVA|nr:hypothetical protein C7M84_000740 [Penaeus vannamei]